MRTSWLTAIAPVLAAATSIAAQAGNLRDDQQVEIAPSTEGRHPAEPGLSLPSFAPKGTGSDHAPPVSATQTPERTVIDSLPLLPGQGIDFTIAAGAEEPAALPGEDDVSIAGMVKYRKTLP